MNKYMDDMTQEDQELERVANLLTPKFPRKSEFVYAKPRKRWKNRVWTIGGIAAMVAIILTVVVRMVTPVSASDVINTALADLSEASNIKVEFVFRGEERPDIEEIYRPKLEGDLVSGTLFIVGNEGDTYARVDWHDAEKNSIILDGKNYIRLKDGEIASRYSSVFTFKEVMSFINLNTIPDLLKNTAELTTNGNIITATCKKNDVALIGEFRKDTRRLIRAKAIVKDEDGREVTIFETTSIDTDVTLPDNLFL